MLASAGIFLFRLFPWGRRIDSAPESESISWGTVAACVMGAICLRLLFLLVFGRTSFFTSEIDEIIRWQIAKNWSLMPFLFTAWDGIWLTGSFAYFGTCMLIFDDPLIATQIGNCIAQIVGIVGLAYTGYVVGNSRIAAIATALLASVGYTYIWLGYGAMSEVLMAALIAPAFVSVVQFLGCEREAGRRKLIWAATAGIILFLFAANHYVAWIAIITGIPFLIVGLIIRRRHLAITGWIGVALIILGMGLFPVLWMYGSWYYLGDAMKFYENTIRMNVQQMGELGTEGVARYLVYPKLYLRQSAPLLLLIFASIMAFPSAENIRRRYSLGLFGISLLLVLSLRAESSGFAIPHQRYTILPYTLTFPLVGAAIADVWQRHRSGIGFFSPRRLSLAAMLALLGVGWCGYNYTMSLRYNEFCATKTWPQDTMAIGHWLKAELANPQLLTPEEAHGMIGVHEREPFINHCALMAYASGAANRWRPIAGTDWKNQIPGELRIIITNEVGPVPGFTRINTFGQWRVFRRL